MKKSLIIFLAALSMLSINASSQNLPGNASPTYGGTAANGNSPSAYNSEGYGSRAEVFVSASWFSTNSVSGNSISQQTTNSGGGSAGYRFNLNSWSSLEGRYGFTRNSQKYDIGGSISSIPTYLSEVTGNYVYKLPRLHRVQPFLEGGGGIVHFSPGNYGASSATAPPVSAPPSMGGSGGGTVGPYSIGVTAHAVTAPVYTGSSAGAGSQTRPAFSYGAGVDFPAWSHFTVRLEYRGLGYSAPDFNVTGLKTKALSFLSEPSIGLVYRF